MKAISNLIGIYLGFEIKVKQLIFFQIGYISPRSGFAKLKHCFLENKDSMKKRKYLFILHYWVL